MTFQHFTIIVKFDPEKNGLTGALRNGQHDHVALPLV